MSTAGRALVVVTAVVLGSSCGTVFEETRPEALSAARLSGTALTETVVIPRQPDRDRILVTEDEAWAFLRTTVGALPATEDEVRALMRRTSWDAPLPKIHGMRERPFQVVPVVGVPVDPVMAAFMKQYDAWCEGRGHWHDCSGVLRGKPYVDAASRYQIAFDIALTAVWDGFAAELRDMVDVRTVKVIVLTAMVIYMATLAFPELTTKVVAATITVVLTAFLGAQAVWDLVAGWIQMVREVDAATTFSQVHAAGERYGQRIGGQTARILVMVVTAAIAEGGLVARALSLPKATQASAALRRMSGGRVGLGAVKQVAGAAVVANGITLVLGVVGEGTQAVGAAKAAGALGMAMSGPKPSESGATSAAEPAAPTPEPGQWKKAKSPARGRAAKYQQQITGHDPEETYMVNDVEFDGYDRKGNVLLHAEDGERVLLDAKGKGYARFFKEDLTPEQWFEKTGAKKLVEQARRQREVAKPTGIRIRWHVAEKKAADAIKVLLNRGGVSEIEVVHTPMQP